MRTAFATALERLCERDERVVLLTGDLGFGVFDEFAERHPDRFINAGVAEQNMLGIATGLAEAGQIPFVYSIATFASMRPYEFIRNGPLLHRLPVRVVGVGTGFDYGVNGVTHYALEDVAIMRAQPEMTVLAPADREQTITMMDRVWDLPGPLYIRLGKEGEEVPGLDGRFELGASTVLDRGEDLALIALGSAAAQALAAAAALRERGIEATVAVVSTLGRDPDPVLTEIVDRVPLALTVEAGYRTGGLGSAVAEIVAERGAACRVVRCGVEAMPHGISGSRAYLDDRFGISADRVLEAALEAASVTAR